jgi:MIP family channel proteins
MTREAVPRTRETTPTGFWGAIIGEILGTYILVLGGTGTVVAVLLATPDDAAVNRTAISLAFGMAVVVPVYAFIHVSGAHINPTVTVALAAVGKFPWRAVPAYIVAQLVGAVLASLTVWMFFGERARSESLMLGATPVGDRGWVIAFIAEVILGFLLLVVIMSIGTDDRATPAITGLTVGVLVAVGIYVTLTISGGSFNAARTLGPMIVSGHFPDWWLYVIAPTLGGVLGAFCYEYLARPGSPPE